MARRLALFALGSSRGLGERVAEVLGHPLARHEEREFEDGEHKARPLESVREADAYVLHSLHGEPGQSVNDKLCRLLFFCACLRDAGAGRVTAVAPYLPYARKDRRTKPRDPVTSRYVATLFEACGVDRVVAMDVHNPAAFENAFRCRAEHLEARFLLARHLAGLLGPEPVVVASPDAGGVKRADRFREALEQVLGRPASMAFMEKRRSEGVLSGDLLAGEVEGASVVLVDDLVATGATLVRAARACRARGARTVRAVATHGLFVGEAARLLADPTLDGVAVTDTVARPGPPGLAVLGAAPLLGEAIRRLNEGGSLVELA